MNPVDLLPLRRLCGGFVPSRRIPRRSEAVTLTAVVLLTTLLSACSFTGESPGGPIDGRPAVEGGPTPVALPDARAVAESAAAAATRPPTQVVRSAAGVVSSASIPATEVGAAVLAAGGNAADAAVAVGFALAVTEPSMSGIGGRASIVVRTPSGEVHGIDGLNQVPWGFREGEGSAGYERATVPGVPAALEALRMNFGSWEAGPLLEPAANLARYGFPLAEGEARRLSGAAEELATFPGSSAYLRPDGRPWAEGDVFVQPEKARVLEALAQEGIGSFYHGWIADSIHVDMARSGGFVTRADLAGYEALEAIPVRGAYLGHTLLSNFRPASGHAVVQALQTLEILEESEDEPGPRLRRSLLLGESLRHAIDDRHMEVGSEDASARHLTSREHARARAQEIRRTRSFAESGGWIGGTQRTGWQDEQVLPSAFPFAESALAAGAHHGSTAPHGDTARTPGPAGLSPGHLVADPTDREATTHFTVVDSHGMVVSVTQSLGPSLGTRVVSPGLGFAYATRLGSEPGSRPSSTISPTIVLDPHGEFLLALGGAGDARIISAVAQVIHAAVGRGLPLDQAVAEPRMHPLDDGEVRVEEGPVSAWTPDEWGALGEVGLQIVPSPSGYFGRVHAVARDGALFLGVAEPRWEGSVAEPRP